MEERINWNRLQTTHHSKRTVGVGGANTDRKHTHIWLAKVTAIIQEIDKYPDMQEIYITHAARNAGVTERDAEEILSDLVKIGDGVIFKRKNLKRQFYRMR
jgi:predicted transcriptional regulator